MVLLAGGLYLEFSKPNTPSIANSIKNKSSTNTELKNYGASPEFTGVSNWLNSEPITMEQLKGKVVLIDFWTYSCINCIRTLPYVTGWYEKYKDQGFVVVGVHTPEFAFEKDTGNVQTALKRHHITYPVAQDNDYGTWRAYNNRYWPAHYLIDKNGNIAYTHFGEGNYTETEQAIQTLLGINEQTEMAENDIERQIKTPEIYFGLDRLEWLAKDQKASSTSTEYSLSKQLEPNHFTVSGQWSFTPESATLQSQDGKINLNFSAQDVHMVARSDSGSVVRVLLNGELIKTVEVKSSDLYTLYEGKNSSSGILELEIIGSGFEAFTFTFG